MLSKQEAIRIGHTEEREDLVKGDEGGKALSAGRDKDCYLFMTLGISFVALSLMHLSMKKYLLNANFMPGIPLATGDTAT